PEDDVASATSAVVTLHADLPIAIRSDGATPAIALVRPSDDDLEVVLGGATTIYERTSALPRIRWAKTAVVEPDATRAIDLVLSGTAPDVVLAAPGPEPSGAPATLDVVEDSGDTIAVDVDAEGLGYLVVADGLQDRWSAAIDGAAVPLVDADHGYVAVEVPPGTHRVELRYAPPLPGGGFAISGGGLALIGALFMIDRRSRRRGTVRSSTTDPSGPVEPPG
ncbi:MAG: YfhO family protein, partial [Actinomycetota bacterium]|nr:YfhO family protein [Actinomycetota bacterium]